MLVEKFIEDNKKLILKQNGNTPIKDDELITYLERAYNHLQKDKTLFTESINILSTGEAQYQLNENTKDVLHLFINTQEYEKKRVDEFFEQYPFQNCKMFAYDNGTLFISPNPKENETITIFCEVIKGFTKDENEKDTFIVPVLFQEALRYCFLAKVHEETPRKEFVDFATHYLKLYTKEMAEAKRVSKVKYRNLQTQFKKI